MNNSFMSSLFKVYVFQCVLFVFLCLVTVCKGTVVSLSDGNNIYDSVVVQGFAPLMIPCLFVIINGLFSAFFFPIVRMFSYLFVMPYILYFMISVTIPMAGHVNYKRDPSPSELSSIIEKECTEIWNKAQQNPNGPEADMVRSWEMYNGRSYLSQIPEYKEKADSQKLKENQIKESMPFGSRWILE